MTSRSVLVELQRLRSEHEAQLATLTRDRAGVVAASADANLDDEHDPEGATVAWEREQLSAAIDRARTRLTEVDAALSRAQAGRYGTCTSCGRPIDDERLAARPATATCRECAR